ncbi:cytochrome P450 2C39-like [Bufo gargarizans]|uniref:cytochrome P450 2C39-like n=1 Tax=Bufo gargarizans TaxID=30331 RepID=UPI001CF44072|nr:cytochrome P450 2C39-like [Bufo gargarizans]
MELLTVLALSLVSLLTLFILISWARQHRYRSLPPGPSPIPVLGTPKYMDLRNVTMKFQKLSQEYGTVFTIWKMSEPVIVLYGYETVKEALVDHRDQFSGRPTIPAMHAFSKGYDINGPRWRSLRRFTSTTLKNFGMGNKTLEMRLLSESKCLIQAMSETGGKPFNPKMFLACTVGNIISSVLFGDHFDFQDEKLQDLLAYTSRFVTAISSPLSTLCNTVPALLKVPVIRHQVLKRTKFLAAFVTNYIKGHKETLNPESQRDYMDHYLMKMKEVEHEMDRKPFNPKMFLACTVGNIISSVLFGDHFDFQDEKLQDLLAYTSRFVTAISSPLSTLCNTVPALLKVPVIRHQVLKRTKFLAAFVTNYIKGHKETLNPESQRDYMDHYLMKMKEVEHEMDPDFCETSLLAIVSGLLAAGTYTMTSTLKFSLVVMAHYPEIQAKVQQEIDELTKSLRLPEIMDKPQLPYTNAVIHEVQRILDLSPVALFHATTEEVKFRSYTIPKGAIVIPFLTSVLTDPSQWETPEEFNPGHFLDEDGQFRTRLAFMPFSTGRRSCLGEHMARMEIFLIFSALLQKFTFTLPPGAKRQNAKFLNSNKHQIIALGEICAELRSLSK